MPLDLLLLESQRRSPFLLVVLEVQYLKQPIKLQFPPSGEVHKAYTLGPPSPDQVLQMNIFSHHQHSDLLTNYLQVRHSTLILRKYSLVFAPFFHPLILQKETITRSNPWQKASRVWIKTENGARCCTQKGETKISWNKSGDCSTKSSAYESSVSSITECSEYTNSSSSSWQSFPNDQNLCKRSVQYSWWNFYLSSRGLLHGGPFFILYLGANSCSPSIKRTPREIEQRKGVSESIEGWTSSSEMEWERQKGFLP